GLRVPRQPPDPYRRFDSSPGGLNPGLVMERTDITSAVKQLRAHAARLDATTISDLLEQDPSRAARHGLRVGPLQANFARQRYDDAALEALFSLADTAGVARQLRALFD